ncbi:polysaccharide deacetylase family protein [Fodinicurvata sediminis]|uniref:polysaccharide deacetylase family protein n=1 Tax=Fodinicurvata sediminis TaxID=1121832 RepID=UPI0009DC00EE|nr:polysaccharide deacetylase family protein [Fodinicurvata sediminis]
MKHARESGPVRSKVACLSAALGLGLALCALSPVVAEVSESELDKGAIVLMYHRFGESDYPSTNVTLEQFEAQLEKLESGPYEVMALPEIVSALDSEMPLPSHAVAISIDDAYRSVYTEAWPRLEEAGFPVTLFVATDVLDRETAPYMTWDELREMAESDLVTIGHQTASHPSMPQESLERNEEEIRRANARFKKELGQVPELFAYPYGESSTAVQELVAASGFTAAFGQHSGAIGVTLNRFNLPRFALNERFSDPERLDTIVNALPLPVRDVTPENPLVSEQDNPPVAGFTVDEAAGALDQLSCYSSGPEVKLERLERRVELRFSGPLAEGRTRLNCTLPAGNGRWRWFGQQFLVPEG